MDPYYLAGMGLLLVLVGFALLVVGVLRAAMESGGEGKGAVVVVVGPVPIAFGNDRRLVALAMALAAAAIAAFVVLEVVRA